MGSHTLTIYLPPFNPQRNEDEIAAEQFRQIHCHLVWVEVTEDHLEDGSRPILEFKDQPRTFTGLPRYIKGEIIQWLQREYEDHMQVQNTLYEDYRIAENQGRQSHPKYRARLFELLLLNAKMRGTSLKIQISICLPH